MATTSGESGGVPVVNPYTGFVTGYSGGYTNAYVPSPIVNPGTGNGVVTSYSLGPISAGANSPLGGIFGFLQNIGQSWDRGVAIAASDYAAGLNTVVGSPQAAGAIIAGRPLTDAQTAQLQSAQAQGLSPNPFVQTGQIAGSILGTGTAAIGTVLQSTGATAAPGVSQGAQQGAQGVTTVAAAGASGGFLGSIQGLGSGLATTLGANSGDGSLIFIAVVVLVIILAAK